MSLFVSFCCLFCAFVFGLNYAKTGDRMDLVFCIIECALFVALYVMYAIQVQKP